MAVHKEWYDRGHLPHYDTGNCYQSLTYRLGDSLPQAVLQHMKNNVLYEPEQYRQKLLRKQIEHYLDAGYGSCLLGEPAAAQAVIDTWKYNDGHAYRLIAGCVMPNHVHVLIQELRGHPLGSIIQTWKSYSARIINKIFARSGQLWMQSYWDRYIRDDKHFWRTVHYIRDNPVQAGLVKQPQDWAFSLYPQDE